MEKEIKQQVTIRVKSGQTDTEGVGQSMEVEESGQLLEKEDALYVLYEESETAVKNLLKIEKKPLRVTLKKSGAVSWEIVFREEFRNGGAYKTPYGELFMEVETISAELTEAEHKISLHLTYALWIQELKQAVCRLELEIMIL